MTSQTDQISGQTRTIRVYVMWRWPRKDIVFQVHELRSYHAALRFKQSPASYYLGLEHEPAKSQSLVTIYNMIDYVSNKVFTEAAMRSCRPSTAYTSASVVYTLGRCTDCTKHVCVAEQAAPAGEVMFGTDSHTCNAGAFGQFASGVGNTDAGFILGTGKLLIKVPQTLRFVLDGEMPPYLMAKDLILHIIGEIGVAGT